MRTVLLTLLAAAACCTAQARVVLVRAGKPVAVIITQSGATKPELYAAMELEDAVLKMTGVRLPVHIVNGNDAPENSIIIGQGPVAEKYFPETNFSGLDREQFVARTSGSRLLLAGGRPRGTMYAVYRFLHTQCGVRWWTPWASNYPHRSSLTVENLLLTEKPAFESRDPFWFPAFNATWAARNLSNSQNAHLDDAHGGAVRYDGFVHTFYPMMPPEKYSAAHPEYYALVNGKRIFEDAQLCTTNPEVRDLIVDHIREQIKANPLANILSVSQNDCFNACQCPICKAIDDAQGSYSGSMLTLVNYVAEKIGREFPDVAIDTLAYQYTRKAPKDIRPLPNVIVRLCSIECNFAAALDDPSNKKFAADIQDWNRLSKRLYIWDYTTNFAHYVQPHPNWFILGKNLRFFHDHGAKGVFEQGAYQSSGSEMSEMRAWVIAQLLWNPDQDDTKLIKEFLDGYYGKAAEPIWKYMLLLSTKAKGYYMTCYSPTDAPFLSLDDMIQAETLWTRAEQIAKDDPSLFWRVQQGHLPVRYVYLQRWSQLRLAALRTGKKWPLSSSRKAVSDEWLKVATGPGPDGWSPMTHLNEGGTTPQAFCARFGIDPPEPVQLPTRASKPAPPPGLSLEEVAKGVDIQDTFARLYREGEQSEVRADAAASDGLAIWMPGTHHEWAVQFPAEQLPARVRKGIWKVYAVVRADAVDAAIPASTAAMTLGIWDATAQKSAAQISVSIGDTSRGYKSVLIGTVEMTPGKYIWAAPPASLEIKSVWIDRLYFVPVGS